MKQAWRAFMALLFSTLMAGAATAQSTAAQEEAKKIFEAARQAATVGPAEVPLAAKGALKLPEGHFFIPQPHATRVMVAMGNPGRDPALLGLVFPQGDAGWFMTVRYEDSGHIKDDEARDWKPDDLLKSYREGTDAANEERIKQGATPIEILGWAEKPAYDAATHRLVWAMSTREKGAAAADAQGVNYNTYVLGREGYYTLNLVTALQELPAHKPAAATMLAALNFNEGQRYADFDEKKDRVAEYGLAALVTGVAAKKLGLLAAAGLFIAKFAKVILLGLAVVGAGAAKLFKRGGKGADAAPPAPPVA